MKTQFLIYQCVLSQDQIQSIRCQKNSLIENLIILDSANDQALHSLACKLTLIIIDFNDILSNANISGYRFNSYILNMLILKLTFFIGFVEMHNKQLQEEIRSSITGTINVLGSILLTNSQPIEPFP